MAAPETPTEIQIVVGDLTFDALVSGPTDGELVILLHGFPQSSFEWRHQIPALAAMGFRVLAPNQRGYSPGTRPKHVKSYAARFLVEDVVGMAQALGYETFHAVGHDFGASVAWYTAMTKPNLVRSLCAISVPHPLAFQAALDDASGEQAGKSSYMEFFRSEGAEAAFLADDAALLRMAWKDTDLTSDEIQQYLDVVGHPAAIGAALNWYRARTLPGEVGTLHPIQVPVTYIWSSADPFLGRAAAERTADYVDGPYSFEVLEGVGHWVPEEAPDRVNEILREHLTGRRSP